MHFLQVELGFENGIVDDIFFVPGYDLGGFVVAQVKLTVKTKNCLRLLLRMYSNLYCCSIENYMFLAYNNLLIF